MYDLTDYDYDLPSELIAQYPADRRNQSRLLRLEKNTGTVGHHRFDEISEMLAPTDALVVNNTAVVPARLIGKKTTGGRAEVLVLDYPGLLKTAAAGAAESECLVKASKTPKPGARIDFGGGLFAQILARNEDSFRVRFGGTDDIDGALHTVGRVPLPPYIRRTDADPDPQDRFNYQTVYAREKGAVAAPTAGLHFTGDLLDRIRKRRIPVVEITLHVGYGTFVPVKVRDIRKHRMHPEAYRISPAAAAEINRRRLRGGRVVAVGTTCVRALEHATAPDGRLKAGTGTCELFIYPGYRFKLVEAMITNFHLPRSTLLMLVSALAGKDNVLGAYREAVERKYRFYSYGDAMLIE